MDSMTGGLPEQEPTRAELDAIVAEWPEIEAGLRELDEEIRAHLAMATRDRIERLLAELPVLSRPQSRILRADRDGPRQL